jgi:hypothetical protein
MLGCAAASQELVASRGAVGTVDFQRRSRNGTLSHPISHDVDLVRQLQLQPQRRQQEQEQQQEQQQQTKQDFSGDWEAFNELIYHAVIRFPDATMETGGITLNVKNLQCTQIRVDDISITSAQLSDQQVVVTSSITGMDMTCVADYDFGGYLVVSGSGSLLLESLDNSVMTETVMESANYNEFPPHDSWIQDCQPTVNINELDFRNGGFWEWTLDGLENLFRGRFERIAQDRFCAEMEDMSSTNIDGWLEEMKLRLLWFPEDIDINPLQSETALIALNSHTGAKRLINWQEPESYPFGFWFDQAWEETVTFLQKPIYYPDSFSFDLNANKLLRQHVLGDNGALVVKIEDEENKLFYEGHDQWMHTRMTMVEVRILGLDTLTALDPLVDIGQYTVQSKLAWESLTVQADIDLEITPSTLPDSYIVSAGADAAIRERVQVDISMDQVTAGISVLLALDQDKLESLQVGHFLDKDNILSCLLTSIYQVQVASFSVEAIGLRAPKLSGFVSPGLDRMITNMVSTAFTMYEASLLKSSRAYFQDVVRDVVNESIQKQYHSYGQSACTLWELVPMNSSMASSSITAGVVDFRDLLLDPQTSFSMGGFGNQRYGDLFSGFVMPSLERQVLTDDKLNARFIRPFTSEQSGQEGKLALPSPLIEYRIQESGNGSTAWISRNFGWEWLEFKAYDSLVENIDTVGSPVEVLQPLDSKRLSNAIRMGDMNLDRPLKLAMMVSLSGKADNSNVSRDMRNEMNVSLTVPSSRVAFDMLVAMNETSLLHFPLKDLTNQFCWLAAMSQHSINLPVLDLRRIATALSSFSFDVACVSCSSPGSQALPTIVDLVKGAGFSSFFQPHVEQLLADMVQIIWDNMNINGMLRDAPSLCPHNPLFVEGALAKNDSYGWSHSMNSDPAWSRASVETLVSVGILTIYMGLFVVAQNYVLDPSVPEEPIFDENLIMDQSVVEIALNSDGKRLIDWTDLTTSIGSWAEKGFEEAREYIKEFVLGPPSQRRGLSSFNHSDTGAMIVDCDAFQFDSMGLSVACLQAQLEGMETISQLDPFIAVGPQNLENNLRLDALTVTVDLEVSMDQEVDTMTVSFSLYDVAVQVPMVLAIDLDRLGEIELGTILWTNYMFSCMLAGAHAVHIPELHVKVGRIDNPVIEGFLSPELLSAVKTISQTLFDTFGEDLVSAIPRIFGETIRGVLNSRLEEYVKQQDPVHCSVDAPDGEVDFRDLFLSEEMSRARGGSGDSPYGDLFSAVYKVLDRQLSSDEADERASSINSMLAAWTKSQSNVSGALEFPGSLMNTSASFVLGEMDATMSFHLGDVSIHNVDTLGSPLSLLDPVDAHLLNSTISLGVGSEPVQLKGRLMLAISDDGK